MRINNVFFLFILRIELFVCNRSIDLFTTVNTVLILRFAIDLFDFQVSSAYSVFKCLQNTIVLYPCEGGGSNYLFPS